jgi:hypothetical protein
MSSDREQLRDSLATAHACLAQASFFAERIARESFYRDIPSGYPHRWSNAVLLSHDIAVLLDQLHRLVGPPHHMGPLRPTDQQLAGRDGSRLPPLQQEPIPGAGLPLRRPGRGGSAAAQATPSPDAADPALHPSTIRTPPVEVGG